MAGKNNSIESEGVGLYFNSGTDVAPVWLLAVCSTSDGFDSSVDAVTTSTKCDGGWVTSLPGDGSWSFSHSALANYNPGAGKMSYKEIEDLFLAKTVGQWKLESVNVDDDYYWEGEGWISALTESTPSGEYLTVDITVTGSGEPTNVKPAT